MVYTAVIGFSKKFEKRLIFHFQYEDLWPVWPASSDFWKSKHTVTVKDKYELRGSSRKKLWSYDGYDWEKKSNNKLEKQKDNQKPNKNGFYRVSGQKTIYGLTANESWHFKHCSNSKKLLCEQSKGKIQPTWVLVQQIHYGKDYLYDGTNVMLQELETEKRAILFWENQKNERLPFSFCESSNRRQWLLLFQVHV